MSNLKEMGEEFKEHSKQQLYNQAQQNTIVRLNQKIKELETENEELKKKLETSSQINPTIAEKTVKKTTKDEALEICARQMQLLNEISQDRELNFEETKKLDLLIKGYRSLTEGKPEKSAEITAMTEDELLNFVKLAN